MHIKDKQNIDEELIKIQLQALDNGLKVIRMLEDEFDNKCKERLQKYIDMKKELRAKLKH